MQRNSLYLIVGALVVVVIVLGVVLWDKNREPQGVEIKLNENGVSVQQK